MKNKDDFMVYKKDNFPHFQFDLEMLQKQASPMELEFLFKNNIWPWSTEIKDIFLQEIAQNSLIQADPNISLDYYQKVYNENAIRQLLGWNTKEGQFILRGVTTKDGVTFKCKEDKNGNNYIFKSWLDGYNLWNGYENKKEEKIKNEDLPNEIYGFSFLNGSCNPCDNLEYGNLCPFRLKLKNHRGISAIWEQIWSR